MASTNTIIPTDPNHYTFFGYMGITCALVLGNFGAAYGTAKSGVGVCSAVTVKPELLFPHWLQGFLANLQKNVSMYI